MAPVVSSEEEFRMLYCALKITGVKPAMPDLAVIMGLKNSTAYVILLIYLAWLANEVVNGAGINS